MAESALSITVPNGSVLPSGDVPRYRVDGVDRMTPFFMSLVGPGDGWAFVSSSGAITAGRGSPEHALFPYLTDDQLLDTVGRSGSSTTITLGSDATGTVWTPFARDTADDPQIRRAVEKTLLSDEIVLEERHTGWALCWRVSWRHSPSHGLVRSATLTREAGKTGAAADPGKTLRVFIRDGVVNVLPPGVSTRTQRQLSNLLDAYKLTELDRGRRLAWTRLNSGLTDLAEPCESLLASTVWLAGMPEATLLVDPDRPDAGQRRGARGQLLAAARLTLVPGETRQWSMVLDVDRDAAQVADLRAALVEPERHWEAVQLDLQRARDTLSALVESADGLQSTGDLAASAHHTSSVLFNVMRGGVPADGATVHRVDVEAFLEQRRLGLATVAAPLLDQLPETATLSALGALAEQAQDVDLRRLLGSYLPLTFSRRHGDPTRPWNTFSIQVADASGRPSLRYEGNWRDIFQNWEALAYSFPDLLDPMIRTFLDAMTIDGYNPYRIATEGVDWEVPEPDNPWSNIGYWSDHQVPYLTALLEARLRLIGPIGCDRLVSPEHVYAAVPYRIADYAGLVADPRSTVHFDEVAHAAAVERAERIGGDGRLLVDAQGNLVRATMAEKLLLIVAAKIANLVPGAGIWMNTQRPEWNDANNALVGTGVSVVSTAQLIALVDTMHHMLGQVPGMLPVSPPLARLWRELTAVLEDHRELLAGPLSPRDREGVMTRLGEAGARFRGEQYGAPLGSVDRLAVGETIAGLELIRTWLVDAVERSWGPDGLVTSYQVMRRGPDGITVSGLGPMLEGQVAVLASGLLDGPRAVTLLDALRASALWCPARHTYLLYPDRRVPGFLERNMITAEQAARTSAFERLADADDRRLIVRDAEGVLRFAGGLRSRADVDAIVAELSAFDPEVRAAGPLIGEVFEEVFEHASFTGRAGSFFAYEGLGSVYWHMVSKLVLAVRRLIDHGWPEPVQARLVEAAEQLRTGLGHARTPEQFGAIPVDPYSHTPSGAGARQPGMTGQVKEDILARWSELGVTFEAGAVLFSPDRVAAREWPTGAGSLPIAGNDRATVGADCIVFSWCGTPVAYRRGGRREIELRTRDGVCRVPGWRLPREWATSVRDRRGVVTLIEVRGA